MALTTDEATAFQQLGADIGAWKADLQAKLDAATAAASNLQTSETADQGTIKDLQDKLAAASAAVDNTPDVVAAINALDQSVNPPTAAATPVGEVRTGTEPAVPGGPPAPENPALAPDPTTVPGGTAAVTTDLNAPSQQNVPGGISGPSGGTAPAAGPVGSTDPSAAAPASADGAPATTTAEAQTATPDSVATSGGPVDAPGTIPGATGSDANANANLSDVPGHGSTDAVASDANVGSAAPSSTSGSSTTF
jgi:hypothetical protein